MGGTEIRSRGREGWRRGGVGVGKGGKGRGEADGQIGGVGGRRHVRSYSYTTICLK